jgi:exopolysaccharide biosynthesis polyprenyl glycosylphosphotransferase
MLTIAVDSLLGGDHSVSSTLRLWMFGLVFLAVARIALLSIERGAGAGGRPITPTLIVGAGAVGHHVVRRLRDCPEYGLGPVGFLDADPMPCADPSGEPPAPLLGSPDELGEVAERTGARHVILAFASAPDQGMIDLTRRCRELGLGVSLVPRFYEAISDRDSLDYVGGLPLLTLDGIAPNGWQFALKHVVDRLVAFAVLLVAAPMMLAIAAAVRLGSPGPVLFRQQRVGRDGRVFELYKFRTMAGGPIGPEFVLPDGVAPGGVEGKDRRTTVGRWLRAASLDELPQLFNVLRGEMSLVGPRPERPEFVERFTLEVNRYQDRHRVKSGITGWAQVNGLRGQTSIADRVEWDNHYIQNWSFGLELRTLVLTIAEIMRFREGKLSTPAGRPRLADTTNESSCVDTPSSGPCGASSPRDPMPLSTPGGCVVVAASGLRLSGKLGVRADRIPARG